MFLFFVGIAVIVVCTIQTYKTAKSTERNAPLWAAATALLGLAMQYVLPFMVGLAYGIYLVVSGESMHAPAFGLFGVIEVGALVLSIVAMFLVMRHVSRVKDDDATAPSSPPPPPPPSFDSNQ